MYEDESSKILSSTNSDEEGKRIYSTQNLILEDKWLYASSMKIQRLGGGVGVFSLNKEALAMCISHREDDFNLGSCNGSVCLADLGYDFS